MASAMAGHTSAGVTPDAKAAAWKPHESRLPQTSTRSRSASAAGVSARRSSFGLPPSFTKRVPATPTSCMTTAATGIAPR